jgi:hypothetical protein
MRAKWWRRRGFLPSKFKTDLLLSSCWEGDLDLMAWAGSRRIRWWPEVAGGWGGGINTSFSSFFYESQITDAGVFAVFFRGEGGRSRAGARLVGWVVGLVSIARDVCLLLFL